MKIKEYDPSVNIHEHSKEIEEKINDLLSGDTLTASWLDYILKYLGYDDEEVICGMHCVECPYHPHKSGTFCSTASSNYVRSLISRRHDPLEELL